MQGSGPDQLVSGQRLQLPGEAGIVVVRGIEPRSDGLDIFVAKDAASSEVRMVSLTSARAERVKVVTEDDAPPPYWADGDDKN